jgi:hypothetical protein
MDVSADAFGFFDHLPIKVGLLRIFAFVCDEIHQSQQKWEQIKYDANVFHNKKAYPGWDRRSCWKR